MSVFFEDDFASGNFTAGGWTLRGSPTIENANPQLQNSYKAKCGWSANFYKAITARDDIYVQLLVKVGGNNASVDILSFWRSGTQLFTLWRDNVSYKLKVSRGAYNGFLLGESSLAYDQLWPLCIDIYYHPDASNGAVIVKVNGDEAINLSGVGTVPGAQTQLDRVEIGRNLTTTNLYADNIRFGDAWVDPYTFTAGNRFSADPACKWVLDGQYRTYIFKNLVGPDVTLTPFSWAPGRTNVSPLKGNYMLYMPTAGGTSFTQIIAPDANLPTGFPFKNGDTAKNGSFTWWWRPLAVEGTMIAKGRTSANAGSFVFQYETGVSQLRFSYRRADTGAWINNNLGVSFTVGHDYHLGVVIDGKDNKTVKIRIHDKTAGTTNNYSYSIGYEIGVDGTQFAFGTDGGSAGGNPCNGYLNEFACFARILTDSEIDKIRNDTFGSDIPPDSLSSKTWALGPAAFMDPTRSATTCEAIPLIGPAACRSLTISQDLLLARPHACLSATHCPAIRLYNSGFFYTL